MIGLSLETWLGWDIMSGEVATPTQKHFCATRRALSLAVWHKRSYLGETAPLQTLNGQVEVG
jgi:hypothetical protein